MLPFSNTEGGRPIAPRPSAVPLVGREGHLRALRDRLRRGAAVAIDGAPGVGKTAMALELANDPELRERFPEGVLWASLGRDGADPMVQLRDWADAVGVPPGEADAPSDVRTLGERIGAEIGARPFLIVMDDAWNLATARSLEVGGPACAHLCTTRLPELAREFAGPEGEVTLDSLPTPEALDVLYGLAPDAREDPEAARSLVESVGGLPLALVLLGYYLRKAAGQPRRVRATLQRFRDVSERLHAEMLQAPTGAHPSVPGPTLSLGSVIRVSDEALGPRERRLLREVSIFKAKPAMFTVEAALSLSGQPAEVLASLVRSSLVEEAAPGHHWMHQTIADYARSGLTEEERVRLHRRASEIQDVLMSRVEEQRRGASSYEQAYHLEQPEWRDAASAKLYHAAQSRVDAGLALSRQYLDAFFWWAMYDDEFSFCRDLLDQWQRTQSTPDDREWLRVLREFDESYPIGHARGSRPHTAAAWSRVEESLRGAAALGGWDRDLAELSTDQRHVRAMSDLFLAESYRYRSLEDPRAEKCLREALELVRHESRDAWIAPWALYFMADLEAARGQAGPALEHCRETLAAAAAPGIEVEGRDHEIIANAHRVWADVLARRGEMEGATHRYQCAVLHALAYQAWPHPPDTYTSKFYREVCQRMLDWIEALWARSPEDARRAIASCREFWSDCWEPAAGTRPEDVEELLVRGRHDALRSSLFPPEPRREDLGSTGYAGTAVRIVRKILARDACAS
jgi:hypothetical protein